MTKKQTDFHTITNNIMKCYRDNIHEYLDSNADGTLTDADIIVMIMNITIGVSTNIYYSLKQILPNTKMDFDFMKAKMGNSIFDAFEKIKDYKPEETMMALTVEQVKEIQEKGFTILNLPNGQSRRVTKEDIMVKKSDVDKLIHEAKKESISIPGSTGKIITPHNGAFRK